MKENRPTIEITTPVQNIKVVLYEWITGGEYENINQPLMSAVSVKNIGPQGAEIDKFDAKAVDESNHRAIENVVVSIDGSEDAVLKKVLDMHIDDYSFVLQKVSDIAKKKS